MIDNHSYCYLKNCGKIIFMFWCLIQQTRKQINKRHYTILLNISQMRSCKKKMKRNCLRNNNHNFVLIHKNKFNFTQNVCVITQNVCVITQTIPLHIL